MRKLDFPNNWEYLVGVKPSDADLSEDDFMQSNGEQVEEPGTCDSEIGEK